MLNLGSFAHIRLSMGYAGLSQVFRLSFAGRHLLGTYLLGTYSDLLGTGLGILTHFQQILVYDCEALGHARSVSRTI